MALPDNILFRRGVSERSCKKGGTGTRTNGIYMCVSMTIVCELVFSVSDRGEYATEDVSYRSITPSRVCRQGLSNVGRSASTLPPSWQAPLGYMKVAISIASAFNSNAYPANVPAPPAHVIYIAGICRRDANKPEVNAFCHLVPTGTPREGISGDTA